MTADSAPAGPPDARVLAPRDHAVADAQAPGNDADAHRRVRRLLAAQQLSGLGSWEWDVEHNTVDWSDELFRMYGLEPGSFAATFEAYLERVHPDDRARVATLIGDAVRTGGSFAFEERIIRPDGEERVLRSVGESTIGEDGRVVRLIGACQDITEERAMQEGLRRSEAAYRAMFELAADAIFVHDCESGAILDVNRKGLELHGYSLDELRTGGVALISAGEQPFTIEEAKRRLDRAAAGTPQSFEWHVRRRSGEELWVEVRLDRITMPAGDRIIAVVRDISERRRAQDELQRAYAELERRVAERTAELAQINAALRSEIRQRRRSEQALQRSEEHFRALIENSSDVASILGPDGTILYQSQPIERVLGWGAAALVCRSALEFVHPDDVANVTAELQALASDPGEPRRAEFRFRHIDGSYRVLESIGRGHRFGELEGIVVNSRDITDRREAAEELRLQAALLRAQGEASIDGILVVDPEGRVLSYNQRFIELWEIPDRIIELRSDADAIAWVIGAVADADAFARRIDDLYRNIEESSRDEILLKDGRVLDRYSAPVRGSDGEYYGRVWYFRDITKRRRNEEALRQARFEAEQARERAEQADRAKSEFLSRMSHELRTPLNSILGFAQLLQRRELPPDQQRAVEYILKGGRHLLNLINEVLEIARIETNAQSFSLEPVEVHAVVQESLMLIRPLAAEHELRIEDATAGCDAWVWADRQRLTQVVLNLLSNAVKYNVRGGRVRIRCAVHDADGGRVRIAVEDTGPGIAADKRERIFTPFERLGAEQSGVEGTGLGLALSRRLCEAMGGTLDFETELGSGSVFWGEFRRADRPVARRSASEPTDRAAAAAARRRPATILYIEDNLANLSLVESVMGAWPGLDLIPALQGRMGLELALRHAPDLILLDLHLPDLPGGEVLRRLRLDPATRTIPVVVITADAMPGTGPAMIAAGADAYLTKPLDLDAFIETIDRLLDDSEGMHEAWQPA
jgi:PAS domain S-box-containing protein